jgi:hypothetical protein
VYITPSLRGHIKESLMPITQERVIAILNAAQDYEEALSTALSLTAQFCHAAAKGEKTWQEALEQLRGLHNLRGLLTRPLTSAKTLAVERAHFKKHARENDAAAARAARKRRRETFSPVRMKKQSFGVHQDYIEHTPARTSAPRTMQHQGELQDSILNPLGQQKYALDPSLAEDELDAPLQFGVEVKTTGELELDPFDPERRKLIPSQINAETLAEIDRLAEAAVKSHPGTIGEAKPAPGVDFEDEADEGTELDPAVAKDRGSEGRGSD